MNQKCVIYARVSSREQEETGYSLDSQEKLLREYAEKNGYKVTRVFRVSESASGSQTRKTFYEMLSFVSKQKISIILCEKIDRLTRNLKDASSINEWVLNDKERNVHCVKESFVLNRNTRAHENFVWDMKVAMARFYTNNLSEEVRKGQKEKIAQGWIPTKPTLGYKTEGERGHKIHVIDEEKAPLVKKMFELYATGDYSLLKLNQIMYEMGLRTHFGNRLVKSRMATLLGDPFYYGMLRWNGEVYPGKQDPLVSKELFDAVQMTLRSKNTPKYRKHFFTFKSLIECDRCGGRITWEVHKGLIYGHCNYKYKDCTERTWYKEHEIEKQIVNALSTLQIKKSGLFEWIQMALKEKHRKKVTLYNTRTKDLNARLEQIQRRLDRLYDDKLDQKITPDYYEKKFREYTEEKDNIVRSIKRGSDSDTKYFEFNSSLFELAQRSKDIYQALQDTEQKRALLRLIFKDIRLFEGKIVCEYTQAFKLLLEAVDLTNSKTANTAILQKENFEPSVFRSNEAKNDPHEVVSRSLLRR